MFGLLATASDPRVAFTLGKLEVRWYGLIIVIGMLIGLVYALTQCKKVNLTIDDGVELFLWLIPLAVVFARILYILPRADEYFPWNSWDDFVRAIAIWDGGITIIGGIVGGILGGIIFTIRKRKKLNFGNTADLVIVPLLTGQIIGRLGNYVNQEAFGMPITNPALQKFPFGVYLTDPSGYDKSTHGLLPPGWYCATFFYEMVWNTIGLVFCLWFWHSGKSKKYPGFLLIFYFFWYCLGRFWLEFVRMDAVGITKIAMGIVAPLALVAGILYLVLHTSKLSYKEVRKHAVEGSLEGAPLTEYDVKNYAKVGKIMANVKNPIRVLYRPVKLKRKSNADADVNAQQNDEYIPINFDEIDYYHVPKHYERRLKRLAKTSEYTRV